MGSKGTGKATNSTSAGRESGIFDDLLLFAMFEPEATLPGVVAFAPIYRNPCG
jgi:hypothetical protein